MKYRVVSPLPAAYHVPLWELMQRFRNEMLDELSPKTLEEMTARELLERERGGRTYAFITDEHALAGMVWAEPVGDGMFIGHLVFQPHWLSSTEKLRATKTALGFLFAEGARKVIWSLFADNRAFHIFLKRLGASHEGTLRRHVRRNGELVDMILMASFPQEIIA